MTAQTPVPPETRKIIFFGREIEVKFPSENQLAAMSRMRHLGTDFDTASTARQMDAVDRVLRLIEKLMVDPADADWLQAELIDERIDLGEVPSFFALLGEAFKVENRATKRVRKTAARRAS